jgi:ketosteroid isomerase-like protein
MKKITGTIIILIAVVFLLSCNNTAKDTTTVKDSTSKEFDMGDAKKKIRENVDRFEQQIKNVDSAGMASTYTADAWVMPPNGDVVKGNDIAGFWGSAVRMMGVKEAKINTDDVAGNEDILVETGNYELLGADKKILDKGKFLAAWKKENGEWKMFRDIWNSSMPLPPPPK